MGMNDNYGMISGYPGQQLPSMVGNNGNMFQNQKTPNRMLKGWAVTSIEEARVATVETDGSICFLPDLANKRIYTKQLNPDGTATFNMYEQKPVPVAPSIGDYVTRAEFQTTLDQIKGLLQELITPSATTQTQPVGETVQQPVAPQQQSSEIVI